MILAALAGLLAFAPASPAAAAPVEVFSTDFESGLPAEMTADGASIQGVQGWAGLGNGSYLFAGSFLRHHSLGSKEIRLDLSGLPSHTTISVSTLVALIDSWDYEYFEILVDGNVVFSQWFDLASSRTSSYAPPAGALLSAGSDLGYTAGYYFDNDHAFDLSMDSACSDIPHTADDVTITWRVNDAVSGLWQGGGDESWAIDGVVVTVDTGTTAVETGSWAGTKARFRR